MKKVIAACLLALTLSSCSMTPMTITSDMVDSAGAVVGTTTKVIADSSVAKEQIVHDTLQADINGYYEGVKAAGTKVDITGWEEKTTPEGVKYNLPLITISVKEAPRRSTMLPTSPSVHPLWHFGEVFVKGALTYGLADLAAGTLETAFDSSQTKYYGDYNYNPQTATPYVYTPTDF
jgi:hypothetical protein